ncbi:MAG: GlsB/YeaQ/YmgE family stress response membrane protein [Acidobacteriota bacterium]|nr:GlsB/YeaQ/YmgE family stress response membrane protein [Acidobacteriota bacterium]
MFATIFETQVVVVNYQGGIIAWLLIGLIAGWLAGKISRGAGYGCLTDIVLGLVGSLLGGWIFTRLGILGGGFLTSLAAATLGAVILVSIVHLLVGNR